MCPQLNCLLTLGYRWAAGIKMTEICEGCARSFLPQHGGSDLCVLVQSAVYGAPAMQGMGSVAVLSAVLAASLHLLLCSNQYFHFQCCFLSSSGRTFLLDDQLCLFKKHCENLLYVGFWHFNIYFTSGLAVECMLTTCIGFIAVATVLLKRETLQFLFIILFLVFIFQLFLILSILAFYLNVFSINLK